MEKPMDSLGLADFLPQAFIVHEDFWFLAKFEFFLGGLVVG